MQEGEILLASSGKEKGQPAGLGTTAIEDEHLLSGQTPAIIFQVIHQTIQGVMVQVGQAHLKALTLSTIAYVNDEGIVLTADSKKLANWQGIAGQSIGA